MEQNSSILNSFVILTEVSTAIWYMKVIVIPCSWIILVWNW